MIHNCNFLLSVQAIKSKIIKSWQTPRNKDQIIYPTILKFLYFNFTFTSASKKNS